MSPLVIVRRELGALFRAPLAYVFLVLFLLMSQIPYVLTMFAAGTADLRLFFDVLPWCVVLFAALISMRSWAEERQENTFEMLLTFPLRDRDLVLGKFGSAFTFLAIGIACTLTLPLALAVLGDPDAGPVVAGYLGILLLAAKWIAAGVFFSGLTRSQLLAALVSAVLGILCLFLGTDVAAVFLDASVPGLGSILRSVLGDWGRVASFSRGVVELADVVWFLGWTAAFLHLNALHVGLRRHPSATALLAVGTPLTLGCALLLGRLCADTSWARADLTEDRLYTLSPGTVRILGRAKVPVRVTFYVSPQEDMPTEYKDLERSVADRLEEIRVATSGRLAVKIEHMKAANAVYRPEDELGGDDADPAADADDPTKIDPEKKREKSLERRLIEKGVRPFAVRSVDAASTTTKLVYATLAVAYREKDEEYLQPITPDRVAEIEYLLANTVARLVRPRAPKIALVLGGEPLDPQVKQMYQQMGRELPDPFSGVEQLLRSERFDVQRVAFNAHEPLPEDYDALLVIGPETLDERQRWELDRALAAGKPTLLAVQRYTWRYGQRDRGFSASRSENDPQIDDLLAARGITVSRDVLMDQNQAEIAFRTGGVQDLFGGVPVNLPTHVLVNAASMAQDSVLVQRLSSVLYLWGTALELDRTKMQAQGLETTVLFTSGPKSWTVPPAMKNFSFDPAGRTFEPRPLAVQVRGVLKSALAGAERPKWPFKLEMMRDGRPRPLPPDTPEPPRAEAPGHLIVIGCARQWQNGFLDAIGNAPFLLNCVDALTLDEDLLLVRSRRPTDRRFDRPSDNVALFWRVLPLGIVPLALVGVGLAIGVLRMRRREAWAAEHGR